MARNRFINPDGKITARRKNMPGSFTGDLYHHLIGMPWWQFAIDQAVVFSAINLLFATLYWMHGDAIQGARPGRFDDCFYFSVQTLATIGYGVMAPKGAFGNLMVCLESYAGLMSFAMMSGLAFAKASVPKARVFFSKVMVFHARNGQPALMFRMMNARGNQIMEARVILTMAIDEVTSEGDRLRRLRRLPLVTAESPVFALSFLATHLVNEESPLHGLSAEELEKNNAEFIVTFVGTDDTLNQSVHGRYAYGSEDIRWGERFLDTVTIDPDGVPVIDSLPFHSTEAVTTS